MRRPFQWTNYGKWHHRGDVYLDGEAFLESETAAEVLWGARSWHCEVNSDTTTIRANFGDADPNKALVEINVRESLFFPDVSGLKFITVDGFHFGHAAANWAPPVLHLQTGAVGPRMGRHWIIQNCTIEHARCVGIILGQAPGVDYGDIDAFGAHIVRNNVIRGVYHQMQGAFGIWMDFGNQGTRISRNIVYDTQAATLFLEMNHGPAVVDHNIFAGQSVRSNSEATVFAHNLFVDCGYVYHPDINRKSQYYEPHTTRVVGHKTGTARDDRWFNNIFVRQGLDKVKDAPGYVSDFNLFLEGAKPSSFGDRHSRIDPAPAGFKISDRPMGAVVSFELNESASGIGGPRVDAGLVGEFPTVGHILAQDFPGPCFSLSVHR